jgi:hypothetical protein
MKRRWLIAIVLVAFTAPAFAQDKPDGKPAEETKSKTKRRADKEQFYDFDDMLIGGEAHGPTAFFGSARQRMRWGRLLRLRKSFIPTLLSTDKYPALKK